MRVIRRFLFLVALLTLVGCERSIPASKPTEDVKKPEPAPKEKPIALKVPETFPPNDWTHSQLADYLTNKGVPKIRVQAYPLLSRPGAIAAKIIDSEYTDFIVYLCEDERRAREQAGALGKGAFSKGRFAFGFLNTTPTNDDKEVVPLIQAALK